MLITLSGEPRFFFEFAFLSNWDAAGVDLDLISASAVRVEVSNPETNYRTVLIGSGLRASYDDAEISGTLSAMEFYDRGGMTESEIQAFLESKSGTCQNSRCLDILRQDTVARNANEQCRSFSAGSNERVSRIIYRVQQACGIAAQVLLVTLQKEQSLVTSTAPTQRAVDYALGYDCPDTAPCNAEYAGIGPQLY